MLTKSEFYDYVVNEHCLNERATDYICSVRDNPPARMVGTHAKTNLVSWTPSKTMGGLTLSLESSQAERAFFMLCEINDDVIEIWEQPQPIRIKRVNKNGVRRNSSYTPDFLLLMKAGPLVVEVKPMNKANQLIDKYSLDWMREADGKVRFLPAEKHFLDMGLRFKVFEYKSDFKYRIANIEIILQSRDYPLYGQSLLSKVKKALNQSFAWSLSDLKQYLNIDSYTPLVQMIDDGTLVSSLDDILITQPETYIVSSSRNLLKKALELLKSEQIYRGNDISISSAKMPSETVAIKALEKLNRIDNGEISRNVYRWKSLIKKGAERGLSPFQSLIPQYAKCGNRNSKIHDAVNKFLIEYLKNDFSKKQGMSVYIGHKRYQVLAQKVHPYYPPVSRTTFKARLDQLAAGEFAYHRGGKRLANADAAPSNPNERSLSASQAWEKAAIDHHLAKIFLIFFVSEGKVYVKKPWITAMIDLHTSKVLAFAISFRPPSNVAVAKVIRDCVRKHGLLPRELIVDRGSEFKSVYYASLLAHYSVINTLRPASHPRYGAEVERLFGEYKTQFLSQREGNTVDYKEVRCIDGSRSPQKSAVLKPEDFYREFLSFCDWRDNKCRGKERESASVRFKVSQAEFPFIGIKVNDDEKFQLATAVESKKYKVDFRKGIHIDDRWYWSPNISKIKGKKKYLEVRKDPENPHIIFALIENVWESCHSSDINKYKSKNYVAQIIDGLIEGDAVSLRMKIKDENGRELIQMINETNDFRFSGQSLPPLEVSHNTERNTKDKIIEPESVNNIRIKSLTADDWED